MPDPVDSFLVCHELNIHGFVSKGYRIEIPNFANAGHQVKNDLFVRLSGYLATQNCDRRIQLRYTRDGDYQDILSKYAADTEAKAKDEWTKLIRTEIYQDYCKQIAGRQLRREYVSIYISKQLAQFIPNRFNLELDSDRKLLENNIISSYRSDFIDLKNFLNLPVFPLDHFELFRVQKREGLI